MHPEDLLNLKAQPLPALLEKSEYMSRQVLDYIKNILIAWKKAILKEAEGRLTTLRDSVEVSSDISDQATIEENLSFHIRSRERERNLLQKIDDSLSLIERGDYGYCSECGIEIGYERMMARLIASMCIDCKTASEIKERHLSSFYSSES